MTLVATLLGLGLANIALRATWDEVDDGVFWVVGPSGVTAARRRAATDRAPTAGIRTGDVLLAIGLEPVERPNDVVRALHRSEPGRRLRYTVLRLNAREAREIALVPLPRGNTALYYVLAAVGIFTLLVAAAVRYRRPGDEATLHFFWLCLAFFGAFTFSFNGRLDRLDWVFYWADAVSILLLPPLFLHFTLVFPERPRSWARSSMGRATAAAALCAGRHRRSRADRRGRARADEPAVLHEPCRPPRPVRPALSVGVPRGRSAGAGPRVRPRAIDHRAAPVALDRVGHGARRDAVRDRLCRALGVRVHAVTADGAVGDPAVGRAAGVRVGDRALSADGRRNHLQARRRLGDRHRGDRRPLHRAAEGGDRRVLGQAATGSAG